MIHISQMNHVFDITSPLLYLMTAVNISVFLFFGVWSLRQRFRQHHEWAIRTQAIVLAAVLVFYIIEIATLRVLLVGETIYFVFALLGLISAGLALYGHIAVSLVSRLMVELVVPDNPALRNVPRLGPAEMLEHEQDWEGALNEYYVLAHIYPGNALIYARIATNLLRLERTGEAAQWFERSLKHTNQANDALVLLRRLWDACETAGERDRARAAVHRFIERFPDHEASPLLLQQLNGTAGTARPKGKPPLGAQRLRGKKTLREVAELLDTAPEPDRTPTEIGLVSLEESPVDEDAETGGSAPENKGHASALAPLDEEPIAEEET